MAKIEDSGYFEKEDRMDNSGLLPVFDSFEKPIQKVIKRMYKKESGKEEVSRYLYEDATGLEFYAMLYQNQGDAFQEILSRRGFQPTQSVQTDYPGKVAFLTHYGTLAILGNPEKEGRFIVMKRIYRNEETHDNERGNMTREFVINQRPEITITKGNSREYIGSGLRALAFSEDISDDDPVEKAKARDTVMRISGIVNKRNRKKITGIDEMMQDGI